MERGAGGRGVGSVRVWTSWTVGVGGRRKQELVWGAVVEGVDHVLGGIVFSHHRHHGVVDGDGWSWREGGGEKEQ